MCLQSTRCRSCSRATRRTRRPRDHPGASRQPAASDRRAACESLSRQSRRSGQASSRFNADSARPPDLSRSLWQATQVLIDQCALRALCCLRSDGARGRRCDGPVRRSDGPVRRCGGPRVRVGLRCLRVCPQSVREHEAEQHGARSDCVPGNSLRHRDLPGYRPRKIRPSLPKDSEPYKINAG